MGEWISVKDKLPTEAEDVLTYSEIPDKEEGEDYSPVYVGFYENGTFYSTYDYYEGNIYMDLIYVTHWMPLPKPPIFHLIPCPKCGFVAVLDEYKQVGARVRCTHCEHKTDFYKDKIGASEVWNNQKTLTRRRKRNVK